MTAPEGRTCPRCEGPLPPTPALSRFDNTTHVCSTCGREEAAHRMIWGDVPGFDYIIVGGNARRKELA